MAGIVVEEGRGSAVTDVDGNTFLDFIGGINVNALGHCHPRYVEAVKDAGREDRRRFVHLARARRAGGAVAPRRPGARRSPPAALFGRRRSGGERAAAREMPHRQVRVRELLGRLSRQDDGRVVAHGLDLQETARAHGAGRAPDPLRRLLPLPGRLSVPELRHGLRRDRRASRSRWQPPARSRRCIVEPMQGTAGNVIPPKDFLPAVRSMADELGALLIADEMITGFGRTGRCWGTDHSGVEPDIMTIGKAFGGGFPLSGCSPPTRSPRRTLGQSLAARRRATAAIRSAPPPAPPPWASSTRRSWSKTRAWWAR